MGRMIDTIQYFLSADEKNKWFSIFLCSSEPNTVSFSLQNWYSSAVFHITVLVAVTFLLAYPLTTCPRLSDLLFPWLVSKYTRMDKTFLLKTLNPSYTFILTCTAIIKFNINFYTYIPLIYIYVPLMYQSWHCIIQQKEHHVLGPCL